MPDDVKGRRWLNQKAVYWARDLDNPTGKYGQPQYEAPVEIGCRWDDEQVEYITAAGKLISKAVVIVDREITLNGVLWKGLLVNVTEVLYPFKNGSLGNQPWAIQHIENTPTRRATKFYREAYLG